MASTKKLSIKPLGDRVVVKPDLEEGEKKLASGIILPPSDKEKLALGQVVATGPGRMNDMGARIALEVKVGDKVYFKKSWQDPIKVDDVEYYVLSESEIMLIKE